MAMLNPKELDGRGGTSGPVAVAAAGGLQAHELRVLSALPGPTYTVRGRAAAFPGWLLTAPRASPASGCALLALDWRRGRLGEESDH